MGFEPTRHRNAVTLYPTDLTGGAGEEHEVYKQGLCVEAMSLYGSSSTSIGVEGWLYFDGKLHFSYTWGCNSRTESTKANTWGM